MGGDFGHKVTVPAVIHALGKHPNLNIVMVGHKQVLERRLRHAMKKYKTRLLIHHAEEIVKMDDLPSKALRSKKKSSMRLAINLVKDGAADACVSAGNTGALMMTASFVLKTLPGINRPAIVAMLPAVSKLGYVRMLDLGANVDCSAEQLQQFAIMGSIISEAADGVENPRIALLNIGTEEIKGNEQVKQAADLLANTTSINYVGFAEGDDVFCDIADVIVSDGFVGNIALKAIEGTAKLIKDVDKGTNFFMPLSDIRHKELISEVENYSWVNFSEGNSQEVLSASHLGIVTSGTASLEAALLRTPVVVVYKTSWITYFLVKPLLKIKQFSLPNLLAKKSILPELLQSEVTEQNIFKAYKNLEENNNQGVLAAFEKIHSDLKADGPDTAARVVAEMI